MSVSILPLVLAILPIASAQEPAAPAPAFLELRAARVAGGAALGPGDALFLGEAVRLQVRVGFERTLLAEQMIPLFRRALDVQAELRPPWSEEIAGATWLLSTALDSDSAPGAAAASLVVGSEVGRARRLADEDRDGRSFAVFALERVLIARAGEVLRLPAASLRFAWASRFESDLVRGVVPLDRRDERLDVALPPLVLLPLPAEGRPPDFGGAVGRFRFSARLAEPAIEGATGCVIELELSGEGDLDGGELPRLDDLPGLHVLGRLERREVGRRVARVELVAIAGAPAVLPPVSFDYFDPVPPGAYRRVQTEPLALPFAPDQDPESGPSRWSLALLAGALLVGLAWALGRRAGRGPARNSPGAAGKPGAPPAARAQDACRADAAADPYPLLVAELAERLGAEPEAIATAELASRLVAAGVPPHLAARLSRAFEAFAATRYGGAVAPDPTAIAALLDELVAGGAAADAARPPGRK